MHSLFQDIRFGVRTCRRNPGFTAVVVLTLALGIGANTAVFSIVNGIWLSPMGYPDADALVAIFSANPTLAAASPTEGWDRSNVSANDFFDWRAQCRSFVDMGICRYTNYNLAGDGRPQRVIAARASASLLPVLGFDARIGRRFEAEEDRPGRERVALLSDGFWRSRFGGDPGVVGRTIMLDGAPYEIIGVLPVELSQAWGRYDTVWDPFDIWTPLAFDPENFHRANRSYKAFGRLKPGVSAADALAELKTVAAGLANAHPATNEGFTVNVMSLFDSVIGDEIKRALTLLTATVGLILLIACLNTANLLLARGNTRSREYAVRTALGASRGRLVRQMLTECTVLSLAGGLLGVLLAIWSVEILVAALPEVIPRTQNIAVNRQTLLFTLGLSCVAAALTGLTPVLRQGCANFGEMLKEGSQAGAAGEVRRLKRDFLIVGQVGMSLALAVCAGLTIKSVLHLRATDPGFDARRLLTMRTMLSGVQYPDSEKRIAFFDQTVREIRALPGVISAAAISSLPCDGLDSWDYATIEDREERGAGGEIYLGQITVTPGYFKTMRIALLEGRDFSELEATQQRDVVIVNEALARRFWPDESAVGKRLKYGPRDSNAPWLTVVGVAGDVKQRGFARETRLETYLPYSQSPDRQMSFVARTDGEPLAATIAVQNAIWKVNPDQAVFRARSMERILFGEVLPGSILAGLLSVFALIALVLAGVGLYGVMSYSIGQRTHEIGIRMALGARSGSVLLLVLRRAALLMVVGIVGGVGLSLALGKMLETLLYGVSPTDPPTLCIAAVVLLCVGLVASYVPARRATRVDPMQALRCE